MKASVLNFVKVALVIAEQALTTEVCNKNKRRSSVVTDLCLVRINYSLFSHSQVI